MAECGDDFSMNQRLVELDRAALEGGGADRVERQHAAGKLTARERLSLLLDPGSFIELDRLVKSQLDTADGGKRAAVGDGVVVGSGSIAGRKVCVFAQDFTVLGGSLGAAHASKIVKVM